MEQKLVEIKFTILEGKYSALIKVEPFILNLRRGFGTSHSFSQQRRNALFTVSIQNNDNNQSYTGQGECGLPPKKPGCYLSDYEDCVNYIQNIEKTIENDHNFSDFDPFQGLNEQYFKEYRQNKQGETFNILKEILYYIDKPVQEGEKKEFRAPQSGLEAAVFSCICQLENNSFGKLANISPQKRFSYYTAAMQDDIAQIIESAQFGLQYTQFLKLKFNENLDFCCGKILKNFHEQDLGKAYCIDANAAWTPEITMEFLKRVREQGYGKVKILEQPFGLDYCPGVDEKEDLKWIEVVEECRKQGILVYADESIATHRDVDKFEKYVDGFNFKLDKAGGMRQALIGIQKAKERGKHVWVGIMVVSDLGTSQAAQILQEGEEGDMDGGLLVVEEKFKGGFEWGKDGEIKLYNDKIGFGVDNIQKNE